MKAVYLGIQERINKPPLILVNVFSPGKVDTVVYDPEIHELSKSDLSKIERA